MFTREELEAMRLADEEIERDFEETEDEIIEAERRDGNLHYIRNLDKWEKAREKHRKYYREHQEQIKEYRKKYYQTHKKKLATWAREHYQKNKETYQKNAVALVEKNLKELPVQIQVAFQRFFVENRMSRETFARAVGVHYHTAYEWSTRRGKPNIKKIRAVYPEFADELDRIMEGAK